MSRNQPHRSTLNVRVAQFHAFSVYRAWGPMTFGGAEQVIWSMQDDRGGSPVQFFRTRREALMRAALYDAREVKAAEQQLLWAQQALADKTGDKIRLTTARKAVRRSKAYLAMPISGLAAKKR